MNLENVAQKRNVILISPNVFSAYSSAVAAALLERQIGISAIIVVKMINIKRLYEELKRDRKSLVTRILNKLIFRSLDEESKRKGATNLRVISEKFKIRLVFVDSVNSFEVEDVLKGTDFDLVVFTGGGIVRSNILSLSRDGVVNCHAGVLPHYRGMDCHKWAILNGDLDNVGASCHFMVEKIDRGAILSVQRVSVEAGDTIGSIEKKIEDVMCLSLVNTVDAYLKGKIDTQEQNATHGKNYYTMHRALERKVCDLLCEYCPK